MHILSFSPSSPLTTYYLLFLKFVTHLALMVLEVISCSAYSVSGIHPSLAASLFSIFLTTPYPTRAKELVPLFTETISRSIYSLSDYWYEDNSSACAWLRYAVIGLFSSLSGYVVVVILLLYI